MWMISKALMNSLCSQEPVAESLADTCSGGEQCVQSSKINTPQVFLSHGRTTGRCRLSQYGMTFARLTDDRGTELLTLFRAGFRVRTSAPPEKESESQASEAVFGKSLPALLARFDPHTSLWKTPQCSLEDSEASLETLPRWGLMLNGELFLRPTLAHRTSASASGLSPNGETFFHTLTTTGLDGGSNSRRALKKRKAELLPRLRIREETEKSIDGTSGGALNPKWAEWFMGWPIGWTELKPLATGRFRQWQQEHGTF